jgi:molecular chaperone GrpE
MSDLSEEGEDLATVEAAVESDLEALQRERDDYLDTLRRLQADFDNYRKRTLKQQTDMLERAAQGIVEKILPVLDAGDLAVSHGGEAVAPVVTLLVETLQKEGLETIAPPAGAPFDPTVHEAVAHEPGDGGQQEVLTVLRSGYRWKGNLLRPAMVTVRG